ncbi:cadherin-like domain-containing protein, partial [Xanthobacter tagetidis]|uniref:cadherin-like domain-containing protein n=2 Tax=Xanthobacter tagetidis TaxID=60216 RepID=UPI00161876F4
DVTRASVGLTVAQPNRAPVATDDARTTAEDTALVIPAAELLANDGDLDGDALSVTGFGGASGGTLVYSGGTFTFTPDADFNGPASFTYTVSDGKGGTDTATVAVSVTPVNDAPVAAGDTATTAEDTPLVIAAADLLANDADIDGDTLSVTGVGGAVGGTVALDDGEITFTPDADFNGDASFTYTVSDGKGGTDTATVNVTVTPVNDAPVAAADTATTAEDTPLVIAAADLLANDADIDGDTLSVTGVGGAVGGTVALDDGEITFTPNANFNGDASFTYTVSDGKGGTDTATVNVTVTPVNDAPVAAADTATTAEDTPLVIAAADLLANDADIDGDTLSVTGVGGAVGGTVALDDGEVTFTPDANFNGDASFTYTVSDGKGGTDTATVNVTVTPVNDAPVAAADTATTAEDTPLVIAAADLLANDADIDGDTLSVTGVGGAVGGTVALDDGEITFTPDADFNGDASFTYTVSDGKGGTDTATVNVTVTPVNDAPVAAADTATTAEDTPLVIAAADLLANDADIDGDTLSVTGVGGAVGGTVALDAGEITFTPDADFNGDASF